VFELALESIGQVESVVRVDDEPNLL
jgi:hypothetical protein